MTRINDLTYGHDVKVRYFDLGTLIAIAWLGEDSMAPCIGISVGRNGRQPGRAVQNACGLMSMDEALGLQDALSDWERTTFGRDCRLAAGHVRDLAAQELGKSLPAFTESALMEAAIALADQASALGA